MTLCDDLQGMTQIGLKSFSPVFISDSFEKVEANGNVLFFTGEGECIDVLGFCFHIGLKRTEAYAVHARAKDLSYEIRTFFTASNPQDPGERHRALFAPRKTFIYAIWKENRMDARLNWVAERLLNRETRDLADYESDHLKNVFRRLSEVRNKGRKRKGVLYLP